MFSDCGSLPPSPIHLYYEAIKVVGVATWITDPDVFELSLKDYIGKARHTAQHEGSENQISESSIWNSNDKNLIPHQVQFGTVSTACSMWTFPCPHRISISTLVESQNYKLLDYITLSKINFKERETEGEKKIPSCQQGNCALGSHIEKGENKIMWHKNNCSQPLSYTPDVWGAGLRSLLPGNGTHCGSLRREGT